MGAYRQSSLRPLAPAAIVAFAIVLLIVVTTSLGGGNDGSSRALDDGQAKQTRQTTSGSGRSARQQRSVKRTYVVKPGDNLAAIAQRAGVDLAELQALNPSLDPQGLVAGQRVKLPQPGG